MNTMHQASDAVIHHGFTVTFTSLNVSTPCSSTSVNRAREALMNRTLATASCRAAASHQTHCEWWTATHCSKENHTVMLRCLIAEAMRFHPLVVDHDTATELFRYVDASMKVTDQYLPLLHLFQDCGLFSPENSSEELLDGINGCLTRMLSHSLLHDDW